NKAVRGFEVFEHAVWEHAHFADDGGHLAEHVVDENRGIGKNYALDRTVRDVTFVPEADIFIGGEHVGTHQPREGADLLAGHGIALVRHRGAAALLAAEWLFDFANFSALQMANFESNFFERGRNQRE